MTDQLIIQRIYFGLVLLNYLDVKLIQENMKHSAIKAADSVSFPICEEENVNCCPIISLYENNTSRAKIFTRS